MSELPTPPRLYGEKEVDQLLKRATELQAELPSRSAATGGLSLSELEEIAVEAGIDPRRLRQAAMELESGDMGTEAWTWLSGERLSLVREAIIPGEIPESGWERVVTVVRQNTHEHGQPSLLGHTLTWQGETASKMRSILVVVSARDGETHVRIEERLHQTAAGLFGGIIGGVGGGLGLGAGLPMGIAAGSALLTALFPLGIIGLSYMGAKEIYRAVVKRRRTAVSELMDRVSSEVTACIASASLTEADEPLKLSGG